jgi:tetratricopeptide (TPR) repeat protein
MNVQKRLFQAVLPAVMAAALAVLIHSIAQGRWLDRAMLAGRNAAAGCLPLRIVNPLDGAVFPPEIVPPDFSWSDSLSKSDVWIVLIRCPGLRDPVKTVCDATAWTPSVKTWEAVKKNSTDEKASITILGLKRGVPDAILSRAEIFISTSRDSVGAPIFYRDVNLPFIEAVKDPSRIRWRFGSVDSREGPRVVLEGLPVCGNCHSFSADAEVLAMDVDYANDKGSYIITRTGEEMTLATGDIITWNDFDGKKNKNLPLFQRDVSTFGLLSRISPDGLTVISTVRDESVFVDKPDLCFSQLFFPVRGILALYSRSSGTFSALPGADDPKFVQSNPVWSPDGKFIVFARSEAYQFKRPGARGKVLLSRGECDEFLEKGRPFRFDLYRIPFNKGRGGKPEPLEGASDNGMSNFFAKFSPDGKWIVFCKARNYMLLQPDSRLFIVPAEGGEARELSCNTRRMNSWHSWSPNGRWLVFSSKANTPYTQLFLSHIDENGNDSPPVQLERFTAKDRAANIPEFVNTKTAIRRIHQRFVDDYSFVRKAELSALYGDFDDASGSFQKALELNPQNYWAHTGLGLLLQGRGRLDEAAAHYRTACALEPRNAAINRELGILLYRLKRYRESAHYLSEALRYGDAEIPSGKFDPAFVGYFLGCALIENGEVGRANGEFLKIVKREPGNAKYRYFLAVSYALLGKTGEMLAAYDAAVAMDPRVDRSPVIHAVLAKHHADLGDYRNAIRSAEKALQFASASGNASLEAAILKNIEAYRLKLSK